MQLSYLGPASYVFHILHFLEAHRREWLWSDGWQMAGILLLFECPWGSGAHIGAAIADDCDILVY